MSTYPSTPPILVGRHHNNITIPFFCLLWKFEISIFFFNQRYIYIYILIYIHQHLLLISSSSTPPFNFCINTSYFFFLLLDIYISRLTHIYRCTVNTHTDTYIYVYRCTILTHTHIYMHRYMCYIFLKSTCFWNHKIILDSSTSSSETQSKNHGVYELEYNQRAKIMIFGLLFWV